MKRRLVITREDGSTKTINLGPDDTVVIIEIHECPVCGTVIENAPTVGRPVEYCSRKCSQYVRSQRFYWAHSEEIKAKQRAARAEERK